MLSLIVAYSANRAIGRDGLLPWHLPSDLKRFREITTGHPVVMGRRTFESIPERFRPLPGRRNLVLTRSDAAFDGAEAFSSLRDALDACAGEGFVIGGAQTYAEALPIVDRVYATEIASSFEGDAFFPELDPLGWRAVEQSALLSENGHDFRFVTYDRTD